MTMTYTAAGPCPKYLQRPADTILGRCRYKTVGRRGKSLHTRCKIVLMTVHVERFEVLGGNGVIKG